MYHGAPHFVVLPGAPIFGNSDSMLETGLEHNEYCVWVIPTWLTSADAYALLKEKIPNFAQYQAQGQIKICTTNEWYLRFGKFEPHVLVQAWMKGTTRL